MRMETYIRKLFGMKAHRVVSVEETDRELVAHVERIPHRRLLCGRCGMEAGRTKGLTGACRRWRAVEMNALKYRARRRRLASLHSVVEPAAPPDTNDDRLDPIALEEALIGLPVTQQAVIRMRYYVGLSFKEIGAALAISQNTAASRCRYALEKLRRIINARKRGA